MWWSRPGIRCMGSRSREKSLGVGSRRTGSDKDFSDVGFSSFRIFMFFPSGPGGLFEIARNGRAHWFWAMPGWKAKTRECDGVNPRNPGNRSVFPRSCAGRVRWERSFFSKLPGVANLFGWDRGPNSTHVSSRRHCGMRQALFPSGSFSSR